ncbi:MAG: condensation domain-containing protein [Pirellulales bacterium]
MSPDAEPEAVFPLPLTPFERYYQLDDSREYPTTFPVEIRFSGTLDRQHFDSALDSSVRRHPLLRARIDISSGKPRWVPVERTEPEVDWDDEQAPIMHAGGEFIDLASEPGLRTWVRSAPDRARVLFQFHHACCDGLAALEFVKDFLALYKAARSEMPAGSERGEPEYALLLRRGDFVPRPASRPSLAVTLRDTWYTIKVWSWILIKKPVVLASGETAPVTERTEEILAFATSTFSQDESQTLRERAASLGAPVNDLLLRDWLLVLRRWNQQHSGTGRGRFRINVPVSVRTRDEVRMPAANRIGYAFVTDEGTAADDAGLLDVVLEETRRIKQWKLALYFLGGLALAGKFPSVIRWALRRNASLATAVLSNVGRFSPARSVRRGQKWTCGDLVLERVCGAPPIRKLTRAAMIVIEYAGQTTFCLRCDPHFFSAEQTRALLDAYVAQISQTVDGNSEPDPQA